MSDPRHVYPEQDWHEHNTDDVLCPCIPRIERDDTGRISLVVHNSYDGREIGEVCQEALDLCGLALNEHRHKWTTKERNAFDHACALLAMHWPNSVEVA